MQASQWERFAVGESGTWARQQLDRIYHVTHIDAAIRVLEDGRIKADLVFDESKLNTERIRVAWLSPNDWAGAGGFRYGNVRFAFDWHKLVEGKRVYWVESIAYGITAARILITEEDHDVRLLTYDPTIGDGPWYLDSLTNDHWWNGQVALEIMVEQDLDLTHCQRIDFVKHHGSMCNIAPGSCQMRGVQPSTARILFLASVIGRGIPASQFFGAAPDLMEFELEGAFSYLHRILKEAGAPVNYIGTVAEGSSIAPALGRAMLASFARADITELKQLMTLFTSRDEMVTACKQAVAAAFGVGPDTF